MDYLRRNLQRSPHEYYSTRATWDQVCQQFTEIANPLEIEERHLVGKDDTELVGNGTHDAINHDIAELQERRLFHLIKRVCLDFLAKDQLCDAPGACFIQEQHRIAFETLSEALRHTQDGD